jgi:hypothetical protein
MSGDIWQATFNGNLNNGSDRWVSYSSGFISLSGALTQIRLTTLAGTPAFDAGAINIFWEF